MHLLANFHAPSDRIEIVMSTVQENFALENFKVERKR